LQPTNDGKDHDAKVTVLADIHAPGAYIHSFSLTRNYVVLIIWPSRFALGGLAVPMTGGVANGLARWNPQHPVLFYVIARDGSGVRAVFRHTAFYSFHTINAHETTAGDIVLDLCRYDDASFLLDLSRKLLAGKGSRVDAFPRPTWTQFLLPGTAATATKATSDLAKTAAAAWTTLPKALLTKQFTRQWTIELPKFDPRRTFQPHRYAYGASFTGDKSVFLDALVKLDLDASVGDDTRHKRWAVPGHYPSEPIFVPRPESEDEDDGVVVSVVLDANLSTSYLLVLDARTMLEVARAEMRDGDKKVVVPFGFHGLWSA